MKVIDHVRCSGLARPMVCAGSLFFENLPEQETSAPAAEGTAFGEWAAALVTKQNLMTHASNGVFIDDDMKYYAAPIAENMWEKAATPILTEQRIDWQTRSGIWIKGSYDFSYVGKDGKLYIDDTKYGWGLVDVKENWQLLGYAIGEVLRQGKAFDRIVMRILQPRPHHEDGPTREWEITYDQLLGYKEQIESRMDKIASGFKELVTSKKCKYCPAAAEACTAFNRAVFHGIDYVLGEFHQDQLSEKEISFQLDLLTRTSEVLKIKMDSLNQLAVDRIRGGKIIPSYMTEENYGNRSWKKGISPKVIETLTGKKIVEEVMLSPAKAEKLGISKELVAAFIEKPFLGQRLVRKDASSLGDKIFNSKK